MTDREKIIAGLEFTKAMITFNPSTGEDIEPENLNEEDKTSYDACVGAITLLKEQHEIVRCKDCKYYDHFNGCMSWHDVNSNNDYWFCADGERR